MPRLSPSTPRTRLRTLLLPAALAASLVALPAGSQTPTSSPASPSHADASADRLQDIERALQESRQQTDTLNKQADELAREVAQLRAELIRAARNAQEHEGGLAELQTLLADLDGEEKAKAQALMGRRQRLGELLGALERLARLPPEALLAMPAPPQDTLRSALLLRAAVPQLEAQARALRRDIESLAVLREEIVAKRAAQQAQGQALAEERARLGSLLARKATLEKQTLAEREQAAADAKSLATEASDVRALVARLEADRKAREVAAREAEAAAKARAASEAAARAQAEAKLHRSPEAGSTPAVPSQPLAEEAQAAAAPAPAPMRTAALSTLRPARPFSQARGRLAFPVQGRMVQAFGERSSTGETRGVRLETQPGAQVVAPYDGQVVFAGPFRDYGQLLIIEHGEGYHMLLAGLERIDSAVSQTLLAGEPVGVMPRPADGNPRLYIELRQDGRSINPLPWMATPIGKVSG